MAVDTLQGLTGSIVSFPTPEPAPEPSPSVVSTITASAPADVDNTTYGKTICLFAGGKARIGCRIIFGPFISADRSTVDMGVSFGFASNPEGTRELLEIAADSNVIWSVGTGSTLENLGDDQIRFYGGTYTQGVDPLVTARYDTIGIAFRPQMLIFFTDFPLAKFNGTIPFFAAVIGDTTDGADPNSQIGMAVALQRIAYSPFLDFSESDFAVLGTQELVDALLFAENTSFLQYLTRFNSLYRSWTIRQGIGEIRGEAFVHGRLEVFDRGAIETPDIILDRTNLISENGGPLTVIRQSEAEIPREMSLKFIDPDQDYIYNVMKAQRPRHPFPVTAAIGSEDITLPIVMDASTAISAITFAKYQEEVAREKFSFKVHPIGYPIAPGDVVQINMDFGNYKMKVIETLHGADWTVQVSAEAIYKCGISISGP